MEIIDRLIAAPITAPELIGGAHAKRHGHGLGRIAAMGAEQH
jgi:hypothetical protein